MNKLRSNKGVSILTALAFMFVAIFVSVVVISMTLTVGKQTDSYKKQEQAYLSVSSAVDYFINDLNELTGETTITYKYDRNKNNPTFYSKTDWDITTGSVFENVLEDVLKNPDNEYNFSIDVNNETIKAIIKSSIPTDTSDIYSIDVYFSLDNAEKYNSYVHAKIFLTTKTTEGSYVQYGSNNNRYYLKTDTTSLYGVQGYSLEKKAHE